MRLVYFTKPGDETLKIAQDGIPNGTTVYVVRDWKFFKILRVQTYSISQLGKLDSPHYLIVKNDNLINRHRSKIAHLPNHINSTRIQLNENISADEIRFMPGKIN